MESGLESHVDFIPWVMRVYERMLVVIWGRFTFIFERLRGWVEKKTGVGQEVRRMPHQFWGACWGSNTHRDAEDIRTSEFVGKEATGSGDGVRVVMMEKQGHRLPVGFLGWKNEWRVTPVIPWGWKYGDKSGHGGFMVWGSGGNKFRFWQVRYDMLWGIQVVWRQFLGRHQCKDCLKCWE